VRGLGIACAVGACLLAGAASGAVTRLSIDFSPHVLRVGTNLTLTVRSGKAGVLRMTVRTPAGSLRRIALHRLDRSRWHGAITLSRAGQWKFRATQGLQWATLTITVAEPTTNGIFGPLGADNCNPPSPRNQVRRSFFHSEVLGTSTNAKFWGLFAFLPKDVSWAGADDARFTGLVGRQMKVVYKFADRPDAFYAVSPDGTRTAPVWGPDFHESSSWQRNGVEWGAAFEFDQVGCWRIHTNAGRKSGDIWIDVLS
jgi:hypothetical protein